MRNNLSDGIARNPSPNFWQSKRVFLTGHTGFKGGWLALWLHQLGATTFGYSLQPPTEPNLFSTADIQSSVAQHHIGDICDLAALTQAMEEFKPDIVLHLAAQPLLRLSYDEPVETYATNVMGTVNILEAARRVATSRVNLIITTDKCYENREQIWPYRESDAMGGHDPYSSSKGCAELVVAAYGHSFFSAGVSCVASARAGNVIGGGDWAKDRLMTDIVMALSNYQSPILRNPASIRPWQHVLEPLSGYLLAVEHLWNLIPRTPECWNFGPESDSDVSVSRVAETVCSIWDKQSMKPKAMADMRYLHEARLLRLDSSKAKAELGWKPRLILHEALAMTVSWYKAHLNGKNMRSISLAQIESYQVASSPVTTILQEKSA